MRDIISICCIALSLTGCDSPAVKRGGAVMQSIGLTAAPAKESVAVDLICDRPACTSAVLAEACETAAATIGDRVGSELRVWIVRDHVTTTVLLGSKSPTPAALPSEHAQKAQVEAFKTGAVSLFSQAATEYFAAPPNRATPLAEVVTRVAMTLPGTRAVRRIIIVISDARQYTRAEGIPPTVPALDFECGELPTPNDFIRQLQQNEILSSEAMRDIDVIFTSTDVTPVDDDRCTYTIARAKAVQRLWEAALARASARSTKFRAAVVSTSDLDVILGGTTK